MKIFTSYYAKKSNLIKDYEETVDLLISTKKESL